MIYLVSYAHVPYVRFHSQFLYFDEQTKNFSAKDKKLKHVGVHVINLALSSLPQ
jgi:hypothetical protein